MQLISPMYGLPGSESFLFDFLILIIIRKIIIRVKATIIEEVKIIIFFLDRQEFFCS